MAFTLPIDRIVTLSIAPVDAAGNPAPLDGAPFWALSEPGLVEVRATDDGLSAEVHPTGALGLTQVVVTADARLGPDVKTLTGIFEIHVVGGEAVSLGITAGELRPLLDAETVDVSVETTEPATPETFGAAGYTVADTL